jgi:hypothetical protein
MPNMQNMNKSHKSRSRRNYKPHKQNGGFLASRLGQTTTTHGMRTTHLTKSADSRTTSRHSNSYGIHKGGSLASDIVMNDATMNPPVMNDYIVSPRIRDSWYSDALAPIDPNCAAQKGGSLESDLVNEHLTSKAETKAYDPAWSPKGDMNSLNLYETTGGARRRKSHRKFSKSKKVKKSKKNLNRKSKRRNNKRSSMKQRGGGSDWIMSQYSLGPNNNPEQPGSWVSQFSSSIATPRADYMNPSTLGLAGSGYPMTDLEGSNVQHVGAPLV